MEYTEKILKFDTIDALKAEIVKDANSKDFLSQRYGVRFLMFNNFSDYNEIFGFISKNLNVNTLHLESLAYGDDKSITGDTLLAAIKDLKSSYILAPFSELVRFYNEEKFRGFFNEIILHEDINNPQKRIYIPIIGLHNRFCDFLKNFGRIAESAPIWQYYSEDDKVVVYVTKFNAGNLPPKMGVKNISTMKEWLKFWKTIAPVDRILCSARPIRNTYENSKPDSIFTFIPIDNAYQFISDFLSLSIPIEYDSNDESKWEKFLDVLSTRNLSGFSLEGFTKDYFNIVHLDVDTFLSLWAVSNGDFDRWLLRSVGLSSKIFDERPYFRICLQETKRLNTPHELFENIAGRIFHLFTPAEQNYYAEERYKLISENADLFGSYVTKTVKSAIREDLISLVSHDNNFTNAKKLLTGVFDFERILSMGWYAIRNNQDFSEKDLKKFYPLLYDYLQPLSPDVHDSKEWIVDYFQEYKKAKIADKYTDGVQHYISKLNKSAETFYNWYYSFEEEHDLLADSLNSHAVDKIYWVDGLGVEYLSLIEKLVKDGGFNVVESRIARTGIPSNTHLNAFEVDNISKFKLGDFDHFAHDGKYKRYETLVNEIHIIQDLIKRIIDDNYSSYYNIAIVSDHGLTALSRLVESKKLSKETKHEGRYIPLDDGEYVHDNDYLIIENDGKKYKVALNHSSLGTKPIREVHGGTTPEEVLVPFMIISNNPGAGKLQYKAKVLNEKIPLSSPKIEIDFLPKPNSVRIFIDNEWHSMVKAKDWTFMIPNPKEGIYNVIVQPEGGESIPIKVIVYGLGAPIENPFDF